MAIFVLRMKTFSRTAAHRGSRATSAAAYRAGERIRDQRTGAVYDHRRRTDVLHKEIVLPEALERAGAGAQWARQRSSLWNAAEQAESRRNARVAREFMLALPHELDAADRLKLALGYARELVERYRTAVDLVIHAPRGDERNHHAHLLATTREISASGLGRKAALELSGQERHRQGLPHWNEERTWLRERWASLTNEALKSAGLAARVSPADGARDPARLPRLPSIAYHIERRGGHSFLAQRLRERHRLRVEALSATSSAPPEAGAESWLQRLRAHARSAWLALRGSAPTGPPRLEQSVARQPERHATRSLPRDSQQKSSASPTDPGELARQSVERWKAYRREQLAHPPAPQKSAALGQQRAERGLDIDLGL